MNQKGFENYITHPKPKEERSKYYNTMVDILDEQFPKGECKERGKAIVMLAYIEMMLNKKESKPKELSKCCKALIKKTSGDDLVDTFAEQEVGRTYWFVCSKCKGSINFPIEPKEERCPNDDGSNLPPSHISCSLCKKSIEKEDWMERFDKWKLKRDRYWHGKCIICGSGKNHDEVTESGTFTHQFEKFDADTLLDDKAFISKLLKAREKEYKDKISASEILWKRLRKWQKEWRAEKPKERELILSDILELIEWKIEKEKKTQEKILTADFLAQAIEKDEEGCNEAEAQSKRIIESVSYWFSELLNQPLGDFERNKIKVTEKDIINSIKQETKG